MPEPNPDLIVTVSEAAKFYGFSIRTIQEWRHSGRLRSRGMVHGPPCQHTHRLGDLLELRKLFKNTRKMPSPPKGYMLSNDAAAEMRVSHQTVRLWVKTGRLKGKGIKITPTKTSWFPSRKAVEQWIARNRAAKAPQKPQEARQNGLLTANDREVIRARRLSLERNRGVSGKPGENCLDAVQGELVKEMGRGD